VGDELAGMVLAIVSQKQSEGAFELESVVISNLISLRYVLWPSIVWNGSIGEIEARKGFAV